MATQHRIIGTALALAISAPAVAAERNASSEEHVGVGAAVVIGAAAGGPVGALLGGAVGAKLGDAFRSRGERADALSAQLDSERAARSRLHARNQTLDREIERLRSVARPELVSLLRAGIEMDLLFRTDEHVLITDTDARLRTLAATLAGLPDAQVRIDGYSDERGDAEYNLRLSAKRAHYVHDALVAAGFPSDRIHVTAHGESPAADATADSFALERRVSMTVSIGDSDGNPRSVAATPIP